MHDLGTPVLPRIFYAAVLEHFGDDAAIRPEHLRLALPRALWKHLPGGVTRVVGPWLSRGLP